MTTDDRKSHDTATQVTPAFRSEAIAASQDKKKMYNICVFSAPCGKVRANWSL